MSFQQNQNTQRMKYNQFDLKELTPHLGATITGADLSSSEFDEELGVELLNAFEQYQLLLFKGRVLTPEEQVRFTRLFGELETFPYHPTQLKDYPEIFRLSTNANEGYNNVGFYWHQDGSFRSTPSAISVFHMVKVPKSGGDTLFANAYEAYKRIPDHLLEVANRLKTIHEGNILHDLVIEHPQTGRRALYLNMGLIRSVTGFEENEKDKVEELIGLFQPILDHPSVMYRHRWQEGDLLLCDNYSVFHQATETNSKEERTLHRTTVAGTLTLNR